MPEPVELFYSYSHKDERLRDQLAVHLNLLQRQDLIRTWHDRDISAGSDWAKEIDENINSAQIILLLVSANFLASDYCYGLEMQRAIARHEAGEACVIPVILRPVDLEGVPFAHLQPLPKDGKPVTTWGDRDKAFMDVAQGIRRAADMIRERQGTPEILPAEPVEENIPLPLILETPEGSVRVGSPLYIERPPIEADCYQEIEKLGALIRVKAPRQMGKTSLMQRILQRSQELGHQSVYLNFQLVDAEFLINIDSFLQWFCASIANELNLDERLDEYWKGVLGSKNKCTNYVQRYLLKTLQNPLTLGLDEVDQVFQHLEVAQDFFGLLRSWFEKGRNDTNWQKFRLVIAHSREVYIPLNTNQSPFNVGLPIELPTLSQTQVHALVKRHGFNWSDGAIEHLRGLVDGHPYLVRKALHEIACRHLTLEQFLVLAPTEEGIYSDHLRRHLENLHKDPQLAAAMRQVVTSEDAVRIDANLGFKLHSMGLVQRQKNDVVPLCNLYRLYFRDRLEVG